MKKVKTMFYNGSDRVRIACLLGMLLLCCKTSAQSGFELLKEVKLSGKYRYSEVTGKDTLLIRQQAEQLLIDNIAHQYMNLTGTTAMQDSSLVVGQIHTVVMAYGMKYKALAYIDTQQVEMKQRKPLNTFNVVPIVTTHRDDKNQPVLDQLLNQPDYNELYKLLGKLQSSGKLSFCRNEQNVLDAKACYIVIADKRENKILVFLSKDDNGRTNLLTNKPANNYRHEFSKADFIWIYVY